MNRLLLRVFCGFVLFVPTESQSQDAAPNFSQMGLAFLKKHCLECHSGDKPKGELSLAGFVDNFFIAPRPIAAHYKSVLGVVAQVGNVFIVGSANGCPQHQRRERYRHQFI